MKRTISILVVLCFYNLTPIYSQCTGCTLTISTAVSTPQVIMTGTKLCITATGNLSGDLVINGGEVCNEGVISSTSIAMTTGELTNYATINTDDLAITGGSFDNQGTATITSLGILGFDITVSNSGSIYCNALGIEQPGIGVGFSPMLNNSGYITVFDLGNTDAIINNYNDLLVTNDFGNQGSANTSNFGSMNIGRDFGNNATFYTNCMIPIGRDWGNTGNVTGPLTNGCGGFSVVGATANSGDFAIDSSFLDMCDTGSPAGGFDGNTGALGINVTNCTCTSNCTTIAKVDELTASSMLIYPNPTTGQLFISLEEASTGVLTIINYLGQVTRQVEFNNTKKLDVKLYGPSGIYFLQAEVNGQVITKKIVKE